MLGATEGSHDFNSTACGIGVPSRTMRVCWRSSIHERAGEAKMLREYLQLAQEAGGSLHRETGKDWQLDLIGNVGMLLMNVLLRYSFTRSVEHVDRR